MNKYRTYGIKLPDGRVKWYSQKRMLFFFWTHLCRSSWWGEMERIVSENRQQAAEICQEYARMELVRKGKTKLKGDEFFA